MQLTIGLSSGVPDGGDGECTEGAEGVCSPFKGATVSTGQTPWSSQGLDHRPKSTCGPVAPATYVVEVAFVGHQWEEGVWA